MKKLFIIAALTMLSCQLFAQTPQTRTRRPTTATPPLPPVLSREVSGIVKDETGQTIIGALVTLKSKVDTLRTATNEDGVFIFKNVKYNVFNVTIESIGYLPSLRKYSYADFTPKLVLDPVVLKTKSNELNEVKINGTPSVIYKTDTVEYKASDYKVHENATLDELLKKMEGFEVGSDGSVTHQGQQIMKAKLNGKEFAGGDVAQAIQNLPADIIEKVQVVDDYGDLAARTGVKDGDPQKVLNVTTKPDRSVGTTGRIIGQAGNDDRYNAQIFVEHINANQVIGVIGNLRNTVNGVASAGVQGGATNGGGGGSGVGAGARGSSNPGTTRSGAPTFNYRDQWSKKIQVTSSYAYSFNNNNSINQSYGQTYTSLGTGKFTNNNTSESDRKGHTVHFELADEMDAANYLQITPTFSYSNSSTASNILRDEVDNYVNDFQHQLTKGTSSSLSTATSYGVTALFVHVFKKPKRNFSVQLSLNQNNTQSNGGTNYDYKYFADSTQNTLTKDSTSNLLSKRTNNTTTYGATATYSEPINSIALIEFRADIRRANNNVTSIEDSVLANGQLKDLTALDNIYNYTTTQTRASINYHYNGTKVNLTLGATAIPYNLTGTKVDENNGQNVATSRNFFRVIPAFRFAYAWSQTERFTLTYTGANQDPQFNEIQPFTDKSDPKNIKVGNPNLSPSFNNSISAQFNDYIANSKFNLSLGVNATSTDNSITTNTIQLRVPLTVNPIDPSKNTYENVNETNYVNLSGAQAIVGRYSISKQLDDRRYNLSLNGNISYTYTPAMSNDKLYHSTDWRFDERLGPRINPNENIEVNPFIEYDIDRTFTTATNNSTMIKTTKLEIDGKMYFFKTFQINYMASKNFITGISGYNTNPLVLNAGFQKEFLQKKNLVITFDIFDLLHQNNFIQQVVTPQGVTNTMSNSLSRYFLVGVRLNLQKWSGVPKRNGRVMQRRGDGSFIYE